MDEPPAIRHLSRFAAFLLLALSWTNAPAEEAPKSGEPQARSEFTSNPVFSGQVYLEQWGEASNPSVILVHGLGHNGAKDWQYLAPVLSSQFHVIAFDLPGMGRSSRPNELYSPDNYARFVDWIAATYAKKPFILIGHSMGGNIALTYATQHPDNVRQLILVDAAGILHRAAFSKHLIDDFKPVWWMHLIPSSEQFGQMLGFGVEDYDRFPFAINLLLTTEFGRRKFLGADPIKIAGLAMVQKDFSGELQRVTMPTLLVWGGKDTIAPVRTGKMLAARLPNASLEIIPDAQHVPMTQATAQLNDLVWKAVTTQPQARKPASVEYRANDAKIQTCDQQQEVYYRGRIERLIIKGCRHVTIEDAKIDLLEVKDSSLSIYNSEIGSGANALIASGSTVFATASTFSAEVPVKTDDSRLDFAGVDINAGKTAFEAEFQSYVTFSLSSIQSPLYSGQVHGVYSLSSTQQPF